MSSITIGLLYSYNENWIGGTYYVQNLIHAFDVLPGELKPKIVVFTDNEADYKALAEKVDYPYLSHGAPPSYSIPERVVNKVAAKLFGERLIKKRYRKVDYLFPVGNDNLMPERPYKLFWIPDFQDHYFPAFFTEDELVFRRNWQGRIAAKKDAIVIFSSQQALNDYMRIFPMARTKNYVIPFAVTHPSYEDLDIENLKKRYGISKNYFISPNQFWAHKNHKVIIDAVDILKRQGEATCVVFTGKPHDYRNPAYYDELRNYSSDKGLDENILFLGFIDRKDQLKLMQSAIAVIQPSKFEGWSTVIEDAKAMAQFVVASRIPVHEEQVKENSIFFDPDNAAELAGIMTEINNNRPAVMNIPYREKVEAFAMDFLNIINSNKPQ